MDDSGYWKTIALELKAKVEEMTQENARLTAELNAYKEIGERVALDGEQAERDRDAAIAARDEMARVLRLAIDASLCERHGDECDAHNEEYCTTDCPEQFTDEHALENCTCTYGDILKAKMLLAALASSRDGKEGGNG